MTTNQQVRVFDNADIIRDAVTMLCNDRLPKTSGANAYDEREKKTAIDRLCWDLFSLQSRNLSFGILVDKCAAVLARAKYAPIRQLRPTDIANEICSPASGW